MFYHWIIFNFILQFCAVKSFARFRDPVTLINSDELNNQIKKSEYKWTEEYYDNMPIDHFSFTDDRTFKLRYFINIDNFKDNSPIFFYTGNEGNLESFALNIGFMWDIAPEYKAAVVFAEHRFYGKSKPFGNETYSSIKNLGYLSSEQALADFAELITYLKNDKISNAKKSPVIAFGGSYGGMLTAWMRIKYPHIVNGGIAASAPVFWFTGTKVSDNTYDKIVTRTFKLSGCNTESLIASFDAIRQLSASEDGRNFLNEAYHLAPESQIVKESDGNLLIEGIKNIMETLAMVDYPYEANFLAPLPAWPVKESCKAFSEKPNESIKINAVASFNILNVFYNTTGKLQTLCVFGNCSSSPFSALGEDIWSFQTCTEMIMPQCSAGPPDDVFNRTCPFLLETDRNNCLERFKNINYTAALYRPYWALINYGAQYHSASNIVFSNGYLDPWSGGGWLLNPLTKGSLVSLIIEDGAHHFDLRGANKNDTQAVIEARRIEKIYITRWIQQANNQSF